MFQRLTSGFSGANLNLTEFKSFDSNAMTLGLNIGMNILRESGLAETLETEIANILGFLKEPSIAQEFKSIGEILQPMITQITSTTLERQYQSISALRNTIYSTIAHGVPCSADTENINPQLRDLLLDRTAYAADLELIFIKHIQEISGLVLSKFLSLFAGITSDLLSSLTKNPMKFLEYIKNSTELYDYLPKDKFHALLAHPELVWENGDYAKFKNETSSEFISKQAQNIFGKLLDKDLLQRFSTLALKLRTEMIQVFDLLAENDKQMMQYCRDNQYDDDYLFNANKKTIIDLFHACEQNIFTQDLSVQDSIKHSIKLKLNIVEQQKEWIKFHSNTDKAIFQTISNINSEYILSETDPVLRFELVASALLSLNVPKLISFAEHILNPSFLQRLMASIKLKFPEAPLPDSAFIITMIEETLTTSTKLKIYKTLQTIKKAQKDGINGVRKFLQADFITTDLGKHLFDSNAQLALDSAFNCQSVRATEYLALLCRRGERKLSLPLLKETLDITPFLLITLEFQHVDLCLDILNICKKRDADFFTLVPSEIKQQEKILLAAIELIQLDKSAGLKILTRLLEFQAWNAKLVSRLANGADDLSLKNIFIPPSKPNAKQKTISNNNAAATKQNEDKSITLSTKQLSIARPLFTSLTSTDPIAKLQILAEEKCSREAQNLQCFALVMSMIQFFQAYVITGKNDVIKNLSVESAKRIRNALVHQQIYHSDSQSVSLILDGEAENLMLLANYLVKASKFNDSTSLFTNPLFNKLLSHGATLAKQYNAGQREQIQLCHRLLYTHWLNNAAINLDKLNSHKEVKTYLYEHAKAALNILKQIYCLKVSGCSLTEVEKEQAKVLRHLNFRLPVTLDYNTASSKLAPEPTR